MSIEQIDIDKVKIGMYINNVNVSWFKHSFMGNSYLINNEKDLTKLLKLKSSTKYVYIDTEKGFYHHEKKFTQDIKIQVQSRVYTPPFPSLKILFRSKRSLRFPEKSITKPER